MANTCNLNKEEQKINKRFFGLGNENILGPVKIHTLYALLVYSWEWEEDLNLYFRKDDHDGDSER